MTDEQKLKALALGKCVFPVGSNQKRFALTMHSLAINKPDDPITDKQNGYLDLLFHQYRRQIPKSHRRLCDCNEAKQAREQMEMKV